ncbi:MAG TPA: hypothetical protein VFA18_00135 [Gemmataceae bacterium]|nr:hypothetical protein [Gemmataceae bacterium]
MAEGRTQHVPALQAALRLEPDVIFWLTDADDFRVDEVRTITCYNRRHIPICTVALTASARRLDNPPLRTLAQQTGGTYAALCTLR